MNKKRNRLYAFFPLLMLFLCPAAVYAEEKQEEKTLAPYFYIEGADPSTDSLPLKETDVKTNIQGTIAETYITQTYANEGQHPINARYIFPASQNAAVHGMKMEIGDQVITAKIKEKEEAKQEFEEAKSEGKSASLLEQQRPNVFSMDVANILPGDTIRIELHYTELLTPSEGTYQFVFPTVVGPRYAGQESEEENQDDQWIASPYLPEGETPPGKYNISVNLSTGVPISDISCKSHEIDVRQEGDSTAEITLSHPEDYAGNRDFILDYQLTGEDVGCGLILDTTEKENYFLLTLQPPKHYSSEELAPREYIFVLDVSGSMYGYPLDTAKELIRDLVTHLKETDSFNVLLFSNASIQLSPTSLPATEKNVQMALELIDLESGGGGTELADALETALDVPETKNTTRSIITITDGYISGEREIFELIHKNLDKANFFSFGIGDSVNRYLIDGMAQTGQGEAFIVTDSEDAAQTASRFRTYVQAPLLTDIQITYDGFGAYDTEPSSLPDLFAQRPLVLLGKWKGEKTGTIKISGKQGTDNYYQEISVADWETENSSALPYLWARKKIQRLSDFGTSADDSEPVREMVTALGLEYSIMTPYTSFIAVTEAVRNPNTPGEDVNQPLAMPLHVSNLAVGNYTSGSEPGTAAILLAALALSLQMFYRFWHGQKGLKGRNVRNDKV